MFIIIFLPSASSRAHYITHVTTVLSSQYGCRLQCLHDFTWMLWFFSHLNDMRKLIYKVYTFLYSKTLLWSWHDNPVNESSRECEQKEKMFTRRERIVVMHQQWLRKKSPRRRELLGMDSFFVAASCPLRQESRESFFIPVWLSVSKVFSITLLLLLQEEMDWRMNREEQRRSNIAEKKGDNKIMRRMRGWTIKVSCSFWVSLSVEQKVRRRLQSFAFLIIPVARFALQTLFRKTKLRHYHLILSQTL